MPGADEISMGRGRSDVVEVDLDLSELIEQHENIDWSDVPDISAAEASAWTARLIEARDRVQEGL